MLATNTKIQDVVFSTRRELFQFLKDYFEKKEASHETISLEDYGRIASWIRRAGLNITQSTPKPIKEHEIVTKKEELPKSLFETRSFIEPLDPQLETTVYPLFYSSWIPIVSKQISTSTSVSSHDTAPQKAKRLLSALLDVHPSVMQNHPIYPFGHQPKYHNHASKNLLVQPLKYQLQIPTESLDTQIGQDHPFSTRKRQRISETVQALIEKPHTEITVQPEEFGIKTEVPKEQEVLQNVPIVIQEQRQITIPKSKKLGKTFSASDITISEQEIIMETKPIIADTKRDNEWLEKMLRYREKHSVNTKESKQPIVLLPPKQLEPPIIKQETSSFPTKKEESAIFTFESKPIEPSPINTNIQLQPITSASTIDTNTTSTNTVNSSTLIEEKPQFSFQFNGSSDFNNAPFVFGSSTQVKAPFTFGSTQTFADQPLVAITEQGSDRKFTVPTSRRRKK